MSTYANTIACLKYLTVQINRHGSLIVVLFGTVGNLLNLLIFSDRSFHLNPCTTYLKWSSSISIMFIWSGLLTRILDGYRSFVTFFVSLTSSIFFRYGISWPNQNPPLCKIRLFVLMVCWSMSTWAFAGAMMDRYLCSNPLVIHRLKSTVRTARRFLIFFFILSIALFAQIFYCYEASVPNVPLACYTQTLACQMYNDWTNILYNILIPSIFMTIFGVLTISNLRRRTVHPIQTNTQTQPTLRKIDRHLRKILFVQVCFPLNWLELFKLKFWFRLRFYLCWVYLLEFSVFTQMSHQTQSKVIFGQRWKIFCMQLLFYFGLFLIRYRSIYIYSLDQCSGTHLNEKCAICTYANDKTQ